MTKLPRVVRLLTQRITVQTAKYIDASDVTGQHGSEAWGTYEGGEHLITIKSGQPHDRERQTFLHENLHAIFDFAEVDGLFHDEELFVGRVTPTFLSWMRENPNIMAYLQEKA